MPDHYELSIPRLTPADRQALLTRADEARQRARAAANRCGELLADSTRRMQQAARLRVESATVRAELEAAVRAYTQVLRRVEMPPEQALMLVKEVVTTEISGVNSAKRTLMEDVARWCIDAYYAA